MDLPALGATAGIGGIGIGAAVIVFRDVIRRRVFPMLTRRQAYSLLVLIVCLVWSLALASIFAFAQDGPPVPHHSLIVAMDSTVPELVYCEDSRNAGRTNADDITDILSDLDNVRIDKETTSLDWTREEQVRQKEPDLIIIHMSAFYDRTRPHDEEDRLLSFLTYLAKTSTEFIIYTRSPTFRSPTMSRAWVATIGEKVPELHGRLHLFTYKEGESFCFSKAAAVRHRLKRMVIDILDLKE